MAQLRKERRIKFRSSQRALCRPSAASHSRDAGCLTGRKPHCYDDFAGWSSLVARWAHNPKVGGSNPPPATNLSLAREGCWAHNPAERDQWFKCCPRNWNLFLARECLESLTNPILFTSFGATQLIVSTLALAKILKADRGSTTREPSIAGLLGIGRGASSGRKNILTTLQPRSERTS